MCKRALSIVCVTLHKHACMRVCVFACLVGAMEPTILPFSHICMRCFSGVSECVLGIKCFATGVEDDNNKQTCGTFSHFVSGSAETGCSSSAGFIPAS